MPKGPLIHQATVPLICEYNSPRQIQGVLWQTTKNKIIIFPKSAYGLIFTRSVFVTDQK
jgi:hypothetical protein